MLLCYLLSLTLLSAQLTDASVCRSVRIHNVADGLKKLENCTVVEGFVKIVLMQITSSTHFELLSFPLLREITEFLILYDIHGLRSIGKLFPNLERIGGETLFKEDTALVVVGVSHLEEIGLYSLREISRGSVFIMNNPNLCYLNTINWKMITKWDAAVTRFYKNSDSSTICPGCPRSCPQGLCWDRNHCQIDESERSCHPLCLGGCRGPTASDCYTCKGALDPGGACVERCPANTVKLQNRRCVSKEECTSYWHIVDPSMHIDSVLDEYSDTNHTYVVFKDMCLKSCPAGYNVNPEKTECIECSGGKCERTCVGGTITSIEDAHRFRGCIYINSSIEINIRHAITQTVRDELEECLGATRTIKGYLKIARSSLTDLKFFTNLHTIYGNYSSKTLKYALYVVDNQNIQELWDWNVKKRSFTIGGRVFFHYNPKLCLQNINDLLEISGYKTTDSDFEIGKGSNGDKFPCNTVDDNITVIVKSFNFIEVLIPYIRKGNTVPVRYVVYYTKDTFQNITMFDDLDPCSDNGWRIKDHPINQTDFYSKTTGFTVLLTDLEPDTQYVCYFTTYSSNSIESKSKINYFSTLPSKPTELTRLQVSSNSSSEINLQWKPPKHVNGKLKEYIVTWFELPYDKDLIKHRDYCKNPMHISPSVANIKPKITKEKSISSNCSCPMNNDLEHREDFKSLCKNFQNTEFPIGFVEKLSSHSCESYFYSYVHKLSFPSVSRGSRFKNETFPRLNVLGPNIGNVSSTSTTLNKFTHTSRYTLQESKKLVPGNNSRTVLTGLRHFSTYVVTVRACRETSTEEFDFSEENRCSIKYIVTVRTQKDSFADNITSLNYTVAKNTLQVWWQAPKNPNGLVLSFELEVQRQNHESSFIECTRYVNQEVESLNQVVPNLAVGKYEFRIRSVTSSGKGLFTKFHSFEIIDDTTYSDLELILLVLLISVFLSAVAIFSHCLTKKTYTPIDNRLVAEVNPNYHYQLDPLYEVARENIEFGDEIGMGTFGKVFEGILQPGNRRCAIKTMKEESSAENENEFLREAALMKLLNKANYVVKLLGVVSRDSPPLVLMELMRLGDLKTYLRSIRHSKLLGNATMIRMAVEIADAMTFMEAYKFVHRDLAARNCMVGSDLTIKVGDFGMARDIYETDYYRKTNMGLLPIRWMAPESLRDGEFTSPSDVWSYGVVLWEIVTKAEQPYQGFTNDQVLQEVITGTTLQIPSLCPGPLISVMSKCWKRNPLLRSTFMQIMISLNYYHKNDEEFKKLAYFYTTEAEQRRDPNYVEMKPVEVPLLQAEEE